jgi:uncharacterized protein YjbI with pentapeptide repeats
MAAETKHTIQGLKDRWTTPDGEKLLALVVDSLRKNKSISLIPDVAMIDGKFDLRGLSFPKKYAEYTHKGKYIRQVVESLKFKNIAIENIDFSHSDVQKCKFYNCSFYSCLFYQVNAEQWECINCNFENTVFKNARLSYSLLNIRKGKLSGTFNNIQFIESQLNETRFSFPIFDNCLFDDCNLYSADFDGSRFNKCKFTGKVNSPLFRKYSCKEFEPNLFLNRIDKSRFVNEMKEVDFSEAILQYVAFSDDLDINHCKFPANITVEKSSNPNGGFYISSN